MRKFDFKLPTPEIGDQFGPIDEWELVKKSFIRTRKRKG